MPANSAPMSDPRTENPGENADAGEVEREIVFYDGHCGLCHGFVRFLLKLDPEGEFVDFAPLQGETFKSLVKRRSLEQIPDSIAVLTGSGGLLFRSDAVFSILRRIGGGWGRVAGILGFIPVPLRDLVYRAIAGIRRKVFRQPEDLCPMIPEELRTRFLP